jgi:hypothetical protein
MSKQSKITPETALKFVIIVIILLLLASIIRVLMIKTSNWISLLLITFLLQNMVLVFFLMIGKLLTD